MHMFKPGDLVALQLPGGDHLQPPSCDSIGMVISVHSTNWRGSVERCADVIWSGGCLSREVPASYLELYESCD